MIGLPSHSTSMPKKSASALIITGSIYPSSKSCNMKSPVEIVNGIDVSEIYPTFEAVRVYSSGYTFKTYSPCSSVMVDNALYSSAVIVTPSNGFPNSSRT